MINEEEPIQPMHECKVVPRPPPFSPNAAFQYREEEEDKRAFKDTQYISDL
jgi:hypothetical protein